MPGRRMAVLPSNGAGQGELQACNSRRRPARPGARGEFQSGAPGRRGRVGRACRAAGAQFLKYPRGRLAFKCIGAIGAAVARFPDTEEVTGSIPVSRTLKPPEFRGFSAFHGPTGSFPLPGSGRRYTERHGTAADDRCDLGRRHRHANARRLSGRGASCARS